MWLAPLHVAGWSSPVEVPSFPLGSSIAPPISDAISVGPAYSPPYAYIHAAAAQWKGPDQASQKGAKMSDSQLTAIGRLSERLVTLKERL
jgi:hypothetical protein